MGKRKHVRSISEFNLAEMLKKMGTLDDKESRVVDIMLQAFNPVSFCNELRWDTLKRCYDRFHITTLYQSRPYPNRYWDEEAFSYFEKKHIGVTEAGKRLYEKIMRYGRAFCEPQNFDPVVAKFFLEVGPAATIDFALEIYEKYLDINMSGERLLNVIRKYTSPYQCAIMMDAAEKDIEYVPFEQELARIGRANIYRQWDSVRADLLSGGTK